MFLQPLCGKGISENKVGTDRAELRRWSKTASYLTPLFEQLNPAEHLALLWTIQLLGSK